MRSEEIAKLTEDELRAEIIRAKEAGVPLAGTYFYEDWRKNRQNRIRSADTYFHLAHCYLLVKGDHDSATYFAAQMDGCDDYEPILMADFQADHAMYWLRRWNFKEAERALHESNVNIDVQKYPAKKLRNMMFDARIKAARGDAYAVQEIWDVYLAFDEMRRDRPDLFDETYFLNTSFWALILNARFPHFKVKNPPAEMSYIDQVADGYFLGVLVGGKRVQEERPEKLKQIGKLLQAHAPMRWLIANYAIYKRR